MKRAAHRPDLDAIRILHSLAAIGITTPLVLGIVTGIAVNRIGRLLKGETEPTDFERRVLRTLVKDYTKAVTVVNIETLKRKIVA